jgi:hypothetical protein
LPILLALGGCVTSGDGSLGGGAYTYVDFLRPHGVERGEAAEQAATRTCDGGVSQRIGTPKFDACMRSRGWRLAQFESNSFDSSPTYDSGPSSSGPDISQQISSDLAATQAAVDAAQQQNNAAAAAATLTEYQFNTIYNNPN